MDATLVLKAGNWSPHFELKNIDTHEVKEPAKNTVGVKGNMFFWPTWTLIIVLGVAAAVLIGWLGYLMFKSGDE